MRSKVADRRLQTPPQAQERFAQAIDNVLGRAVCPATRALMQRISKALDPEVDAGFPGRRSARVTVSLHDGRVLTHLQPDRKGDPELPLSDADLEGKLLELATPFVGEPEARALLERIWALTTSARLPT